MFNNENAKRFLSKCLAHADVRSFVVAIGVLLFCNVALSADVQVTGYGDVPDPVAATQTVTYTMVVDNGAADTANNVNATATVPVGMSFVSATPSAGSCTFSSPNVNCTLGNLVGTGGGGSPITINIVMRATAGGGASPTTTATATTSSTDTNPANNSLTQQTTIINGADLALSVSDSPDPVNGSGVITYTLSPQNLGPDGVVNARIVNTLPPGVSFISATGSGWSCAQAGQVLTCDRADTQTVGNLPQLVIQGRVNVGSGTITNSATISSPVTPDGLPANNTVTTDTLVNPGADLGITKSVSPTPVIAGQPVTFTLNTVNNGPSNASNVTVADSLPAGFTGIAASGAGWSCGVVGQDVTCTRASYNAGASSTITITATAPASVPPAGLASNNTANIVSSTYDGNSVNDSSTVNFNINPAQADLSLTKSKTPNPVAQGGQLTSTVVVRNNGPFVASSPIRMTDTLVAGEVFVSANGTNWTCGHSAGVVTCDYSGSLAVGDDAPAVTIITTAVSSGVLTNTACTGSSVSGGSTHPEGDVNAANDCTSTGSNSTTQIADLSIVKSIPNVADNPMLATDNTLVYRLVITNNGPDTATGIVVTDALPMYIYGLTGLTFSPGSGSLGSSAGSCSNATTETVTCNYSQLLNGESATIDITISRPVLDGAFTNTAYVDSTNIGDPNRNNNSSSVANSIDPIADVEMTGKSITPNPVRAGVNTTYVLSFRNNGPSTAQNVVVTDVFNPAVGDAGFTVVSVSASKGSCAGLVPGNSYSGGTPTLTCNIGSLDWAENQTVTIVIRPNYMAAPPSPRTLANTASITTTTRETDGPPSTVNPNNSQSALLTVSADQLDMLINKTDGAPYGPDPIGYDPSVPANNVFSYRIRVTNLGPSYATGVVFTDTITTPVGKNLSFLGDTATLGAPAAGICSGTASPFTGSGVFTCTVPTGIEAGSTYERILYFRAESVPNAGGDTFSDSVTVTTNEADTNAGNNTAVESTTVRARTDLAVTSKTAAPNPVNLREPFNWTIVVTNNGPANATDPRLSDSLPANMVLTGTPTYTKSLPAGSGNCTGVAGNISFTCDFGAFNTTATATITVPVRITSYAASYTNSASISTQGHEVDPVSGNNSNSGSVNMVKSSIAGVVYRDLDDNGSQSGGGETGISGVQMRLTGTDAYGNAVNITVNTNGSGQYLFDNLAPSDASGYTVTEVAQPAGFSDGQETLQAGNVGGSPGGVGTDVFSGIVLNSNTAATGYYFGEIPHATVSGNVYNDTNGLSDTFVNGAGTNAGSANLTAYLVQGGNVVASSPVTAGGTFSFSAPPGSGYTVVLANTVVVVANGQPAPAPSLPAGWVNTGENNAASGVAGDDGTVNGVSASFTVPVSGDVIDRNFGIEQPPVAGVATYPGQPNPGGTLTIPVDPGAFVGPLPLGVTGSNATDPTAVTQIRITALPSNVTSFTLNGVQYGSCGTCVAFPGGGVTVTTAQLSGMNFDPVDGAVSVVIPYVAIDAAGRASSPGSVTLPIGQLTLSGNVFSDINGNKVKDGSEVSAPITSLGLNAVLTDGAGVVIAVVPIDASGNYVFPVSPNTTYGVVVTTANPAIGSSSVPVTLPSGWLTTGESLASVVEGTPDSRQTVSVLTTGVTAVNFGLAQTAGLRGIVWRDNDHNRAYAVGEPLVQDIVVELLNTSGTVISTTTTDAAGAYNFSGLTPGVDYKVRFRDRATGGILLGLPTNDHTAAGRTVGNTATDGNGATSRIDDDVAQLEVRLVAGNNLVNQSLPLDPNGVVYNSITRNPVPGATVTLLDSANNPVAPGCLMGGTNTQVTGPLGIYQFLLINPAPPGCQGNGVYTIQVQEPAGYLPPPSGIIPPTAGPHTPIGVPGGVQPIQVQPVPPTGAQPTTYYFAFNLTIGLAGVGVVNNHIPLDPITANSIIVTKTGNKATAEIGDTILYTVRVKLLSGLALTTFDLVDNLPAGFRYIPGTAYQSATGFAASLLADPAGSPGPKLTFKPSFAVPVTDVTLTYKVRVGVGAMQGDGVNRVRAFAAGGLSSNLAQFKVKVTGGVFTNQACVAGKVFVDCNNNHIQDAEELGIPGVRLYMEDGTYFITDVEGKYSYCGISPKTHVLKPDKLTLPKGSRLSITSNRNAGDANSLFLDVKNGELIRGDFAEGSCSNTVLEQVKARRSQGEVRAPETDKKTGPALKFEGKASDYPQQGTDGANQRITKPRGNGGDVPVSKPLQDQPVNVMPESSGNTRGNNIRDRKFESQGGVQ